MMYRFGKDAYRRVGERKDGVGYFIKFLKQEAGEDGQGSPAMLRGESSSAVVQETGLAATDKLDMCSRQTRRLLRRPEKKQQSSLLIPAHSA